MMMLSIQSFLLQWTFPGLADDIEIKLKRSFLIIYELSNAIDIKGFLKIRPFAWIQQDS